MPIRPSEKHRYPTNWKTISLAIRERAGQRCEQCSAPNGTVIYRGENDNAGTYMLADGAVFDATNGKRLGMARGSEYDGRFVRIVLTVAHLDHQPENNDPSNLKALCQRCHFAYDRQQHAKTRRSKGGKQPDMLEGCA